MYNAISDITNYFLQSQLNILLCSVLFINKKISDTTNKISSPKDLNMYRASTHPLY